MKSKINVEINIEKLPKHIGIIMDGNGRWAQKRLMPRTYGHKKGVDTIDKITDAAFSLGVKCVSLYVFSTENKDRPQEEVDSLFDLMRDYFVKGLDKFIKKNIRLKFMGDISYFPDDLRNNIINAMQKSEACNGHIINFALNYGSQNEIIRAVNLAIENGGSVTKEDFDKLLYTSDLPELDLIIRTGGEQRLSNFMLYQAAYSELFFTQTLWPDFTKNDLYNILEKFSKRNRRFGKI